MGGIILHHGSSALPTPSFPALSRKATTSWIKDDHDTILYPTMLICMMMMVMMMMLMMIMLMMMKMATDTRWMHIQHAKDTNDIYNCESEGWEQLYRERMPLQVVLSPFRYNAQDRDTSRW